MFANLKVQSNVKGAYYEFKTAEIEGSFNLLWIKEILTKRRFERNPFKGLVGRVRPHLLSGFCRIHMATNDGYKCARPTLQLQWSSRKSSLKVEQLKVVPALLWRIIFVPNIFSVKRNSRTILSIFSNQISTFKFGHFGIKGLMRWIDSLDVLTSSFSFWFKFKSSMFRKVKVNDWKLRIKQLQL